MEENSKVVVFEKKEIALILIFVVVLIVTSFTLGIRLGKKMGPQLALSSISEEKPLNLKSTLEEDADVSVVKESELSDEEKLKRLMDESKSRLNDELNKFKERAPKEEASTTTSLSNPMAGKFTIQLGSYNTVDEARQFAEGFTVRGYSPILNEVVISGKGKWYRVSLGLFDSVEEAKVYIRQEQSLFAGQDHIITEIK